MTLQMHCGVLQGSLGALKREEREILTGQVKAGLTGWWLNTIDQKVDRTLASQNFDFAAVPDNYLTQPPDSMDKVRNNFTIVLELLKEENSRLLIDELKALIYPRVQTYIDQAHTILQLQMRIPQAEYTLEAACTKFAQKQNDPSFWDPPDLLDWVEKLIGDIEYLQAMMELEDKPIEGLGHIVPVSGLVLGCLLRIENELRTVLEVWGEDSIATEQALFRGSLRPNLKKEKKKLKKGRKSSDELRTLSDHDSAKRMSHAGSHSDVRHSLSLDDLARVSNSMREQERRRPDSALGTSKDERARRTLVLRKEENKTEQRRPAKSPSHHEELSQHSEPIQARPVLKKAKEEAGSPEKVDAKAEVKFEAAAETPKENKETKEEAEKELKVSKEADKEALREAKKEAKEAKKEAEKDLKASKEVGKEAQREASREAKESKKEAERDLKVSKEASREAKKEAKKAEKEAGKEAEKGAETGAEKEPPVCNEDQGNHKQEQEPETKKEANAEEIVRVEAKPTDAEEEEKPEIDGEIVVEQKVPDDSFPDSEASEKKKEKKAKKTEKLKEEEIAAEKPEEEQKLPDDSLPDSEGSEKKKDKKAKKTEKLKKSATARSSDVKKVSHATFVPDDGPDEEKHKKKQKKASRYSEDEEEETGKKKKGKTLSPRTERRVKSQRIQTLGRASKTKKVRPTPPSLKTRSRADSL